MRVFVTFCLLATAYGQGYNYQQQQQQQQQQHNGGFQIKLPGVPVVQESQHFLQDAIQSNKLTSALLGGGVGAPQNSYVPPAAPAPVQNFYRPPQPQPQQFPTYQSPPQPVYNQPQQQSFAPIQSNHIQQQYQQPNYYQPPPVVTKDIYVHVAPEDHEEPKYRQPPPPPPPPRKHYRIVFIKAPTPTVSQASLHVKQAPTEEKTIIYVLTRKPDPLDLETALQEAAPKPPSKPEVYFIKYRTQEEAQHAQRTIQAQYDQLGGTTQVSDEGVAPVTSVIGSLDQQQGGVTGPALTGPGFSSTGAGISTGGGASFTSSNSIGSGAGSSSKYLPPIVKI